MKIADAIKNGSLVIGNVGYHLKDPDITSMEKSDDLLDAISLAVKDVGVRKDARSNPSMWKRKSYINTNSCPRCGWRNIRGREVCIHCGCPVDVNLFVKKEISKVIKESLKNE